MGYLQDQVVQTYAGTAARGSAIGTAVSEGMVSYLSDSDRVDIYDGSTWRPVLKTTGSILGASQTTLSGVQQITQRSYANDLASFTVTVTPSSANSRFLLIVRVGSIGHTDGGNGVNMRLFRSGTGLVNSDTFVYHASGNPGTPVTITFLDSPATASSITYSFRCFASAGTVNFNGIGQNSSAFSISSYTVLEVA
jgi:hypothetical protein